MSCVRGLGKAVVMINDWLVMRYADRVSGWVDFLQGVRVQEGKSAGGGAVFWKKHRSKV